MYKLVIADDEGKTTSVPLVRDEITIGRKEGNTIRLTERNVSRRHAKLQKQNGHYVLQDLGSYNGIIINGARLQESRMVRPGDQIVIGDYKLAIMDEGGTTQVAVPPPPNNAADTFDGGVTVQSPVAPGAVTSPSIPSAIGAGGPHAASAATMMGTSPFADGASPSAPPIEATSTFATPDLSLPSAVRDLRIVFLAPAGAPAPVNVTRLPMILGRSEAADICLPYSSISREHARMSLSGSDLLIEDLGSSNGITINGDKTRSGRIRAGDTVSLGVVEFRLARRGEETTVFMMNEPEAPKKRSSAPIIGGVLGGLVVLGAVGFFVMRGGGGTSSTNTAANSPSTQATAPTTPTPPASAAPTPTTAPTAAPTATTPPVATAPETTPAPTAAPEATPAPTAAPVVALAPQQTPEPTTPAPTAEPTTPTRTAAPTVASASPEPTSRPRTTARPSTPETTAAPAPTRTPEPTHRPTATATAATTAPAATPAPTSTPRPAAASGRPGLTGSGQSPIDEARACTGNPSCVIGVLRNRANSEPELRMLIQAYRDSGNMPEARRSMSTYVNRFPSGSQAERYRSILEDQ